eukprot:c32855_g1_i1.p1 GENE.c32855_g1_i1~~c32855_g1_i1.p1  ORF type:complete len:382 (+),score=71.42 c32855_g1_i1:97-1242(+)
MISAAALQQRSLRKVETRDASTTVAEPMLCSSSEEYLALMQETYFEQYADIIEPYTMRSVLTPLDKESAAAIVAHFTEFGETWTDDAARLPACLHRLADAIDAAQAALSTPFVFVRGSSRSPKDAALVHPGFPALFARCLERVCADEAALVSSGLGVGSSDLNHRLHALYIASTLGLRVSSGLDGVRLLCASARMQNDLKEYIAGLAPTFNIVVREFAYFPVELELRGFVCGKSLTALTQYNPYVFFPRLAASRAFIEDLVRRFVAELGDRIPLQNYVLDLVVRSRDCPSPLDDDPAAGSGAGVAPRGDFNADASLMVNVIELNPLAEFAGDGLFSWVTDKPILLGTAPFEFRVLTSEASLAATAATLQGAWRRYLSPSSE